MSSSKWRAVGFDPQPAADLHLCAVHLYSSAGSRVDDAAVLSSTCDPIAGAVVHLQDGDTATTARFAGAQVHSGGFALIWEFPTPQNIIAVRLGSGAERATYPDGLTLEKWTAAGWETVERYGRFPWPGPKTMVAEPAIADPFWLKVVLNVHGDDAPGATTLLDKSATPKTVTASGGAATAALAGAVGGSAISVPGAGVVTVPHHASFAFTNADWCVEFDYWPAVNPSSSQMLINKGSGTATPYPFQIYMNAERKLVARAYGAREIFMWSMQPAAMLAVGQRNSIALSREGSIYRLFLNGALIASTTYAGALEDSGVPITLGAYSTGPAQSNGYFDEIRLTVGAARRVGHYTPAAAPFPDSASAVGLTFEAERIRSSAHRGQIGASAQLPGFVVCESPALMARDMEFGGTGTLEVDTSIKGNPANTPTRARVSILRQRDKALARVAWSDADGKLSVPGLDLKNQQFIALAEYPGNPADPTAEGYMRPAAGVSKLEVS